MRDGRLYRTSPHASDRTYTTKATDKPIRTIMNVRRHPSFYTSFVDEHFTSIQSCSEHHYTVKLAVTVLQRTNELSNCRASAITFAWPTCCSSAHTTGKCTSEM